MLTCWILRAASVSLLHCSGPPLLQQALLDAIVNQQQKTAAGLSAGVPSVGWLKCLQEYTPTDKFVDCHTSFKQRQEKLMFFLLGN
jgi:hypothetical protein